MNVSCPAGYLMRVMRPTVWQARCCALPAGAVHRNGAGGRIRQNSPSSPHDTPSGYPQIYQATFAALVEPFAVGLHGVHSAETEPRGRRVDRWGRAESGLTTLCVDVSARAEPGSPSPIPTPSAEKLPSPLERPMYVAAVSDAEPGGYDCRDRVRGAPGTRTDACQQALRPQGRLVISGACAEPTTIEPVTALLKERRSATRSPTGPDEFER